MCHFSKVLQQCTNHNIKTANHMKFSVDIIFQTGSCLVIHLYSPGGATFHIAGPVSAVEMALVIVTLGTSTPGCYQDCQFHGFRTQLG